jgi:hypothetical protein
MTLVLCATVATVVVSVEACCLGRRRTGVLGFEDAILAASVVAGLVAAAVLSGVVAIAVVG